MNKKCGEWLFFLSPHATSVNLCIHLCSDGKLVFNTSYLLSFWQKVLLVAWFFSLSPLATSVNLCIHYCSACKLLFFITLLLSSFWPKSVVSDTKFVFLFLHLLLLWTCAFAYAQRVSYFSLLCYFYHCDQKVWWVIWNLFFFFSTCYFCELVHLLMFRR